MGRVSGPFRRCLSSQRRDLGLFAPGAFEPPSNKSFYKEAIKHAVDTSPKQFLTLYTFLTRPVLATRKCSIAPS